MKAKIIFGLLLLTVLFIGCLHFVTPAELTFFHDTYRRLSYFPIVLGAVWYGVRGGLLLAVLSSVAFVPHLLLYMGQGVQSYYSELTEIVLYLLAALVVGLITERERKLRINYQQISSQLEKSYERLHQETAQLVQAEEQLAVAQKMSALGELAASLAHEIRNPLSSIRGTAEILLDDYPPEHAKREFVEILLKETERLETTLQSTLDFSRNEERNPEETDTISSVIRKQTILLDHRFKKEKIDLQLNGLEEGEVFFVPASRISQVVFNLLINAVDAVGALSTTQPQTRGRSDSGLVQLDIVLRDDGCRIDFHDNGPGIDGDLKGRIFESFFTDKEGGTGLGLAISRKIVESYGGTLDVCDSNLGGACFSLFLPSEMRRDFLDDFMLKTKKEQR